MPRFSECWRCGCTISVGITCQLCEVAKYCSGKCQKNDIFRHEAECIPASILKTCTACRKSGPKLKACTGCYRAFYCDINCQRSHWERHKIDCEEVTEKIKLIALRVLTNNFPRSSNPTKTDNMCEYFYWGNVPAYDCLNLIENEGEDYNSALKILFLGVGDLRNVALTCASLPDSYSNKLLFTLNDRESCVLARLVLLLYMLIKGDSDVGKSVTEIWYSLLLSKPTYEFLTATLEELINICSSENLKLTTNGLVNIDEKLLKQLQMVWRRWLNLPVQGTSWIQKQRIDCLKSNYEIQTNNTLFVSIIPAQHTNTAKKWLEDGIFRRTHMKLPEFAENPTLTGYDPIIRSGPYSYRIHPDIFPFSGWDYVQAKKFKNTDCLVTMYGDYIDCILRKFMKKLSKQQVSFQIILCDCMDINQHLKANAEYDRILTSNLMDYILLPDLLKLCSEILNHQNSYAAIVTETMIWEGVFWPIATERVSVAENLKMKKLAVEDAKRSLSNINVGSVNTAREFLDDYLQFNDYLRSLFYADILRKKVDSKELKQSKIPMTKELANQAQLHLRDGGRNENRIVFFKPAVNRRRVNMTNPTLRKLEWVPLPK